MHALPRALSLMAIADVHEADTSCVPCHMATLQHERCDDAITQHPGPLPHAGGQQQRDHLAITGPRPPRPAAA